MASSSDTERSKSILTELYALYPKAFKQDPDKIRPLKNGIVGDIAKHLRLHHRSEEIRHIKRAILHYQHYPAYLRAVALGKHRRDLWGKRLESITQYPDRATARAELQQRGLWTENLEFRYRGNLSGLDITP